MLKIHIFNRREGFWYKKYLKILKTVNSEAPYPGSFCDWLVEVQIVKRCEDSMQICLDNFQ